MSKKIPGPFGTHNAKSVGGMLNLIHSHGVPLNTVERLVVNTQTKEVKDGNNLFATWKSFEEIDEPLFFYQNQRYGRHDAVWNDKNELIPKFKLSLYHHGNASLVIKKARDGQLFNEELYEYIVKFMGANISYVDKSASDLLKELNEMYLVKNAAGAFFQGGSGGMEEEYVYIEFWKPAGAQAFVDYINNNFVYKTIMKPPPMELDFY